MEPQRESMMDDYSTNNGLILPMRDDRPSKQDGLQREQMTLSEAQLLEHAALFLRTFQPLPESPSAQCRVLSLGSLAVVTSPDGGGGLRFRKSDSQASPSTVLLPFPNTQKAGRRGIAKE